MHNRTIGLLLDPVATRRQVARGSFADASAGSSEYAHAKAALYG